MLSNVEMAWCGFLSAFWLTFNILRFFIILIFFSFWNISIIMIYCDQSNDDYSHFVDSSRSYINICLGFGTENKFITSLFMLFMTFESVFYLLIFFVCSTLNAHQLSFVSITNDWIGWWITGGRLALVTLFWVMESEYCTNGIRNLIAVVDFFVVMCLLWERLRYWVRLPSVSCSQLYATLASPNNQWTVTCTQMHALSKK